MRLLQVKELQFLRQNVIVYPDAKFKLSITFSLG